MHTLDSAARKAYLSSVVDAIILSEKKIRIVGSNNNIRFAFGPGGQPAPSVRMFRNGAPGPNHTD
jgi:site-specific DNA recombinase